MSVAARYTTSGGVVPATRTRPEEVTNEVVARPLSGSVLLVGVLTVLAGAWGALAPFVAPEFGLAADRTASFTPTNANVYLAVLPGAVALLCGLVMIATARGRAGRGRPHLWFLGLVVVCCGAWFAVGQYAWTAMGNSRYLLSAGSETYLWKELAFTVGIGAVLVLLGANAMGWSVRRQPALVEERYPRAVPPAAAPVQPVVAAPVQPVHVAPVQPVHVAPVATVPQTGAPVATGTPVQPVPGAAPVGTTVTPATPAPTSVVWSEPGTAQAPPQ